MTKVVKTTIVKPSFREESCLSTSRPDPLSKFVSLEHEVYLALQQLVVSFNHDIAELLRAHSLSAPQFNILRILRGALHEGAGSLAAGEIGARLIAHAPDLTRLLDRMAAQGLIVRARGAGDRRVVTARITEEGLALLAALGAPLAELHKGHLGHLGPERLRALKDLLEAARPHPTPYRGAL